MRAPRWAPWLLTAISLAVTGIVVAQSGEPPPRIYVVDFMKVAAGGEGAYVQAERNWWRPVHTERIRRGTMRSWSLYQVRYPDGAGKEYDFVTVNVYDDFADSELDPFTVLSEVHPEAARAAVEKETLASRRLVRGEIWYRIDHLE